MTRKRRSVGSEHHCEITEEMLVNNPEFVEKIKKLAETQSGEPMTVEEFIASLDKSK